MMPTSCSVVKFQDGMRRLSLACLLGIALSAGTLLVKARRRRRRSDKPPLESLKDALVALALTRTPSTSREVLNQGVRRYDRKTDVLMPCLSRRCMPTPAVTDSCVISYLSSRGEASSDTADSLSRTVTQLLLFDGGEGSAEGEGEAEEVLDAYLRHRFPTRASVVEFLREYLAATGPIAR